MKFELRTRDKRALFGLAGALLIYVLLSQAALPAYDKLSLGKGEAVEKEEQLRKYQRALQRKGHYAKFLEQARKNLSEGESRLIRGDNPSLASVEFQGLVEAAATKFGIALAQRSISPARKKDAFFNEITMTLAFDCTPNQLMSFLAELRNSPKFVTVRSSQVSPAQIVYEAPKKGDFQKIVRVNLTLAAILASPPAAASEKKG